jgi:Uma2 family endonuclease
MLMQAEKLMTTEEMLALPDDGKRRWLIDGQLRECPMTVRNRFHSRVMARVAQHLNNWLDSRPEPRGQVVCGEAGIILARDPDVTMGVDAAYISPEVAAAQPAATMLVVGVPVLVVEILSPSDTLEGLSERRAAYRRARVPLAWFIDVDQQMVSVYRDGARPAFLDGDAELSGEPHMPGLRIPVHSLFE